MLQKMTRVIICVFLFVFLAVNTCWAENNSEIVVETSKMAGDRWTLPYVSAHTAVLIDAATGDVLYERGARKKMPPASTTKILAAILCLEMAGLNEIATVSEKADQVGESSIYLSKGDKLILAELIEGALIRSGNDACVAIAEQTAGSLEEFVHLMNIKAVSLGAYDSNFVNPHGLPDKNHYSTAYDLAVIARYAMNNSFFANTVSQKYATINYLEPQKNQEIKNTNKLLWSYAFADGIKTGTTNAAGKCLIASASKNGRRLIAVVLNAPDRFGDAQRLMDWGLNYTETITLGHKGEKIITHREDGSEYPVVLEQDLVICMERAKVKNLRLEAEINPDVPKFVRAGDIIGSYHVFLGEKYLKSVPLAAAQDLKNGPEIIHDFLDLLKGKG